MKGKGPLELRRGHLDGEIGGMANL